MSSSPSMEESKYCTMLSCCKDCSNLTSLRHFSRALSSMLSTLIFLTATMLSSDKRFARWTTANLPLPMGLMSSYLPSMMVWGAAAGSCAMVRLPALPRNGEPYDVASGQLSVQFMGLPGVILAPVCSASAKLLQNRFAKWRLSQAPTTPSAGRLMRL